MRLLVIALAGVLLGADTGIQLARVPTIPLVPQLRNLSLGAALITGVALAAVLLILTLGRWPSLAEWLQGPLLIVYGFVWFQNPIVAYRIGATQDRPPPSEDAAIRRMPIPQITQIALGMQMGLLLVCAGVRDEITLLVSIAAAVLTATNPTAISPASATTGGIPAALLLRSAAGAVLCAIGVGFQIDHMTEGQIPAVRVTLPLLVAFWTFLAIGIAMPRRPKAS